jgi:hypothetical protein
LKEDDPIQTAVPISTPRRERDSDDSSSESEAEVPQKKPGQQLDNAGANELVCSVLYNTLLIPMLNRVFPNIDQPTQERVSLCFTSYSLLSDMARLLTDISTAIRQCKDATSNRGNGI